VGYPLQESRIFGKTKQMEFLVLFIIVLLIAILVLPFVALAKVNSAKRGVDNLATRLSLLEKRSAQFGTASHSGPGTGGRCSCRARRAATDSDHNSSSDRPEEKSVPPPTRKDSSKKPVLKSQRLQEPPINWEQFMGAKLFAWIGGLALFLGVAFFVKYSFEHNLISPGAADWP